MCAIVGKAPAGEWEFDDDEFEDVMEEETLDDGEHILRKGQMQADAVKCSYIRLQIRQNANQTSRNNCKAG